MPFTGFDPEDDVDLQALRSSSYAGPYPIINTALNLSGGSELAWQKRKAASFVFTPLYSGYELAIAEKQTGDQGVALVSKSLDGYCATAEYSNNEGVKIAAAVSISGAAASPNMGYRQASLISVIRSWRKY